MNVTYNIRVFKIGALQGSSVVSIGYARHGPEPADSDGDGEQDANQDGEGVIPREPEGIRG